MSIGEMIKKIRKSKGLTQKELASAIGKGFSTVQKYELGIVQPSLDVIKKISNALNIQPIELMDVDALMRGFEEGMKSMPWSASLESAVKSLGYNFKADESLQRVYIGFPDGTLEISYDDFVELDKNNLSYLQFKLEELRKNKINSFFVYVKYNTEDKNE